MVRRKDEINFNFVWHTLVPAILSALTIFGGMSVKIIHDHQQTVIEFGQAQEKFGRATVEFIKNCECK